MKYLLLLLLIAVVWWIWGKRRASSSTPPAQQDRPEEKMVACAFCGVHLPLSDGIAIGDKVYCCEAHRQSAER